MENHALMAIFPAVCTAKGAEVHRMARGCNRNRNQRRQIFEDRK